MDFKKIKNIKEKNYIIIIIYMSNTNIPIKSISINARLRKYFIIPSIQKSQNILLCFPGGSETIEKFVSFTNVDLIDNTDTTIIVFEGQYANNTYAWQNAFVWLKSKFYNDVLFIDSVLEKENLISNNPNIFLTGKSDGAGFCILYSNLSRYLNLIKGIFVCSGAYFGLDKSNNISTFNINNTITINLDSNNSNSIIVPKNIVIPKQNISITIIHGTADKIMPYLGQNYTNDNAYRDDSIWKKIDDKLSKQNNKVSSNTYTANIPNFVDAIVNSNGLKPYKFDSNNNYFINSYSKSLTNFNFIKINDQNHDWSGHDSSGPDSTEQANKYLDATYLLCNFFNLKLKKDYKLKYNEIPFGFLQYNTSIQTFQNLPITTSSNLIQNYESFQNTNEYNYNLIIFWLIIIIIILLLLKLRNKKVILLK